MLHESNESSKISITEEGLSFDDVFNKPYVTDEIEQELRSANVLILPNEDFREGYPILFPEYTAHFFEFLKENQPEGLKIDIAISDKDFTNIEMHSDMLNLPNILVSWVAVPLLINVISSYLYDYIQRRRNSKEETKAKIRITAEEFKTKRVRTIEYEGDADKFADAMKDVVDKLFD